MTDDNSLAIPPFCYLNGSVLYLNRASNWIVDVWTEEKLVLRWINSLEIDLLELPRTCTLNPVSLHRGILRRSGHFLESLVFSQLLFFFSLRPECSQGIFDVCHFHNRLLENYLKSSMFLLVFLIWIVCKHHWENIPISSQVDHRSGPIMIGSEVSQLWLELQMDTVFQ